MYNLKVTKGIPVPGIMPTAYKEVVYISDDLNPDVPIDESQTVTITHQKLTNEGQLPPEYETYKGDLPRSLAVNLVHDLKAQLQQLPQEMSVHSGNVKKDPYGLDMCLTLLSHDYQWSNASGEGCGGVNDYDWEDDSEAKESVEILDDHKNNLQQLIDTVYHLVGTFAIERV